MTTRFARDEHGDENPYKESATMNGQGIPSIKELWNGVVIDPNAKDANRHLKLAGLSAFDLHLELVEDLIDTDGEDDDEDDFDGDECPECGLPCDECECEDDDGEPVEECQKFPKGCSTCREYECTAAEDEPEYEPVAERIVVKARKKGDKAWKEMGEAEMGKNPALARFLNQIAAYHGF